MKTGNALKYHFSDFTQDQYRKLIKLAKTEYQFARFDDFQKNQKIVLWRHDVDFSPLRALQLAQIEREMGVISTFFFHFHSSFYNLLDRETAEIIKKILKLGHDLGLHFDCEFYGTLTRSALEKKIEEEKKWMENIFKSKLSAISFHNPSLSVEPFRQLKYAGMINAYSDYFHQHIPYVSDSNGYWRHERLKDVLKKAKAPKLQVLTHPGWWPRKKMSPSRRIQTCIEGRALRCWADYENFLKKHGRKNING